MDIQGPDSARVLGEILKGPTTVFERLVYFSFKGGFGDLQTSTTVELQDGTPVLLSRTGYTGEFGFELFVPLEKLASLWLMVLKAGKDKGVLACGLAARDSLRAGAVLPLSHQDIGPWPFLNNPWPFALPFDADQTAFTKEFIGDKALLAITEPQYTCAFVGSDLRKVGDPAVVLDGDGNEIGTVLTCVSDMGIGYHQERIFSIASPDKPADFVPKGLCCGFIKVKTRLSPGDEVQLKDQRRKLTVRIVTDIRPDRTARRPLKEMI